MTNAINTPIACSRFLFARGCKRASCEAAIFGRPFCRPALPGQVKHSVACPNKGFDPDGSPSPKRMWGLSISVVSDGGCDRTCTGFFPSRRGRSHATRSEHQFHRLIWDEIRERARFTSRRLQGSRRVQGQSSWGVRVWAAPEPKTFKSQPQPLEDVCRAGCNYSARLEYDRCSPSRPFKAVACGSFARASLIGTPTAEG